MTLSKIKRNTYWLMASANKQLNWVAQSKSKAKEFKKINYFPSIESYCLRRNWVVRRFDSNFAMTYHFTDPSFIPSQSHINEIVKHLSE
ncbi:MAG: hypothetical protein AAFS12_00180 [Cyanobacteria bacterium J06632_19]